MIDQREIGSRRERLDEAVARVIDRITPVLQTKSRAVVDALLAHRLKMTG